jgi:hypothetical protein
MMKAVCMAIMVADCTKFGCDALIQAMVQLI